MNDIRLIAMDMDGTLLDSRKQIPAENIKALEEAHRQGIHLAICSGRMPGDVGLFALENGLENCTLLASNGAYCTHGLEEEPFVNCCFEDGAAQRVVELLHRAGITFFCAAQNRRVLFEYEEGIRRDLSYQHNGHPLAPVVFRNPEAYEMIRRDGMNKIACSSLQPEKLEKVRRELEKIEGIVVTASGKNNLELMPEGCSKGTAVEALARKLRLTAEQVMVLGDYYNDESMFQYAGWPVAMGNGCEKIRRMARLITLTNDEAGVAWAIRRYALHS